MTKKVNLMMLMSSKRGKDEVKKFKVVKEKVDERMISIFYIGVADCGWE